MRDSLIVDTSFFVALFNRTDQNYSQTKRCLEGLSKPLVTTVPILTETCHLLLKRANFDLQMRFLRTYKQGAFKVYELIPNDFLRIIDLMEAYSDVSMDFADASLIVLAERLQHGRILTFDNDFRFYKWGKNWIFTPVV